MTSRQFTFILSLALLLPLVVPAQSNYYILYEKKFSSLTGAENLLSIRKAFYSFEDKFLPSKLRIRSKVLNIAYRLTKSFVLEYPADYLTGLAQHEIFGHGGRFREFNYTNDSYHLSLPFPFGNGHGSANGHPSFLSTFDETMTVSLSGNESNTVLSDILRTKWVADDSIYSRDFLLYLGAHHNSSFYIFQNLFKPYGDINAYLNHIRLKYYSTTGKSYSIDDLARYSLINICDPFQFISFWHWGRYIISGKQQGKLRMIRIKNVYYLPSFNLGLSPFGAEFYFNNYFKWNYRTFKLYGRYGDPRFDEFWGAGISGMNLYKNKWLYLNAGLDVWRQPSLRLQDDDHPYRITTKGMGVNARTEFGISIIRNRVNIVGRVSCKTDGFVPGERLSRGFTFSGGIGFVNK